MYITHGDGDTGVGVHRAWLHPGEGLEGTGKPLGRGNPCGRLLSA